MKHANSANDSPELDSLLERKLANIEGLREGQPELWATINAAYVVSRGLIAAVATGEARSTAGADRLMMWQTVLEYQIESFFLLIDRRLDGGVALLRMAAELSRDLARIWDDETLLDVWLDRSTGRTQKKAYRDAFRFDESDKNESYVHKLYDLASTFGIHGHILSSSMLQPTRRSSDGKLFALEVPDIAMHRTLEIWLAGFFPLQELCLRKLRTTKIPAISRAIAHFDEMRRAFDQLFATYREALRSLDPDGPAAMH